MLPQHITPYTSSHYRELPLLPYTFGKEYLERTYETMRRALEASMQVFAVRLDLRFPLDYELMDGQSLGNSYIRRFFASLEKKLDSASRRAAAQGKRAHPHYLRFIWCREYNQNQSIPHFHVVIFLNHAAYRHLGCFGEGHDNLMGRITGAWASALGRDHVDCGGLVHVPDNACYYLHRETGEGVSEFFRRASYLCKDASKRPEDGCHGFGCSRR